MPKFDEFYGGFTPEKEKYLNKRPERRKGERRISGERRSRPRAFSIDRRSGVDRRSGFDLREILIKSNFKDNYN